MDDSSGKTKAAIEYTKEPEGIYLESIGSNTIGGADQVLEDFLTKMKGEEIFLTPLTEKGAKYLSKLLKREIKPAFLESEKLSEIMKRPKVYPKLTKEDQNKILESLKNKKTTQSNRSSQ